MGDVDRIIINQVKNNNDYATLRIEDSDKKTIIFVSDSKTVENVRVISDEGVIEPEISRGPKTVISFKNPGGLFALYYLRKDWLHEEHGYLSLEDSWEFINSTYQIVEFPKFTIPQQLDGSWSTGEIFKTSRNTLLFSVRFSNFIKQSFLFSYNQEEFIEANIPLIKALDGIEGLLNFDDRKQEDTNFSFPLASILDWLQRGMAVHHLYGIIQSLGV